MSVPGTSQSSDAARQARSVYMTPGWLAAYGTPIRAGRDIDDHDSMSTAPVALVNEALARRLFANRSPLGQAIHVSVRFGGFDEMPIGSMTIVGVRRRRRLQRGPGRDAADGLPRPGPGRGPDLPCELLPCSPVRAARSPAALVNRRGDGAQSGQPRSQPDVSRGVGAGGRIARAGAAGGGACRILRRARAGPRRDRRVRRDQLLGRATKDRDRHSHGDWSDTSEVRALVLSHAAVILSLGVAVRPRDRHLGIDADRVPALRIEAS